MKHVHYFAAFWLTMPRRPDINPSNHAGYFIPAATPTSF